MKFIILVFTVLAVVSARPAQLSDPKEADIKILKNEASTDIEDGAGNIIF